jgi:hypothetical protein
LAATERLYLHKYAEDLEPVQIASGNAKEQGKKSRHLEQCLLSTKH